jgi:hypothetical protein
MVGMDLDGVDAPWLGETVEPRVNQENRLLLQGDLSRALKVQDLETFRHLIVKLIKTRSEPVP